MTAVVPVVDLQGLLNCLPQTGPFRFVDRVVEIDDHSVTAEYQFRGNEFFYAGHFAGDPVTPGVIVLEAMAQGGVVLQVLYLMSKTQAAVEATRMRTVLTEVQGEIHKPVIPPEMVTIKGELMLWRAGKIRSKVVMRNQKQELVATAMIAGMGVPVA